MLDADFDRLVVRRGFHFPDRSFTASSSALQPMTFGSKRGRVVDGFEVFRITWHAATIFWRTAADGVEQERHTIQRRVVEPFFQLPAPTVRMTAYPPNPAALVDPNAPCVANHARNIRHNRPRLKAVHHNLHLQIVGPTLASTPA
jgi:hypothetical protein